MVIITPVLEDKLPHISTGSKSFRKTHFTENRNVHYNLLKKLRQIIIVVQASNQKYDRSPTFSVPANVPKNFADSLP